MLAEHMNSEARIAANAGYGSAMKAGSLGSNMTVVMAIGRHVGVWPMNR